MAALGHIIIGALMDITDSVSEILKSNDLVGGQFYDRFFTECPHLKSY